MWTTTITVHRVKSQRKLQRWWGHCGLASSDPLHVETWKVWWVNTGSSFRVMSSKIHMNSLPFLWIGFMKTLTRYKWKWHKQADNILPSIFSILHHVERLQNKVVCINENCFLCYNAYGILFLRKWSYIGFFYEVRCILDKYKTKFNLFKASPV